MGNVFIGLLAFVEYGYRSERVFLSGHMKAKVREITQTSNRLIDVSNINEIIFNYRLITWTMSDFHNGKENYLAGWILFRWSSSTGQ